MNAVILACSSLKLYIEEALKSQNVEMEIIIIDRALHVEPSKMKEELARVIENLPNNIDTVLVAMGFCGGAWDSVTYPVRVVIPRVDDCISLLLHTDDAYHPNLKETGHLYIYEQDPSDFSALRMLQDINNPGPEYAGLSPDMLFHMWFDQYKNVDIIDTGFNDCYSEEYVMAAQENADKINADLGYAQGSNRILEKLVSGQWDQQFIVAEPGQLIRHGDFFE